MKVKLIRCGCFCFTKFKVGQKKLRNRDLGTYVPNSMRCSRFLVRFLFMDVIYLLSRILICVNKNNYCNSDSYRLPWKKSIYLQSVVYRSLCYATCCFYLIRAMSHVVEHFWYLILLPLMARRIFPFQTVLQISDLLRVRCILFVVSLKLI